MHLILYVVYGIIIFFFWCMESIVSVCVLFFFFKQKTAYEMRISDWSSDVCSSDVAGGHRLADLAPSAGIGEAGVAQHLAQCGIGEQPGEEVLCPDALVSERAGGALGGDDRPARLEPEPLQLVVHRPRARHAPILARSAGARRDPSGSRQRRGKPLAKRSSNGSVAVIPSKRRRSRSRLQMWLTPCVRISATR